MDAPVPSPLPDADDPGPRYLAPAAGPRGIGRDGFDVLKRAGLPRKLDPKVALSFLAYDEFHAYHSFLEGVDLAPMRCPVTSCPDGTLEVGVGTAPPPHVPNGAPTVLRALIDAAVRHDLTPWSRAAVWLSGGADSSAVAASAAAVWKKLDRDPKDLRFYHQDGGEGFSEKEAAEGVARHLSHDLIVFKSGDGDSFEGTERFLGTLDFPVDGMGCASTLAFNQVLKNDGIDGYLTGDGGDECFGPRSLGSGARHVIRSLLPEAALAFYRKRRREGQLPAWLQARRGRFHDPRHAPEPRQGLEGVAANRDAAIRCARQGNIVAFHRTLARSADLAVGFPLLDARVVDFAVSIPQGLHGEASAPKRLLMRAGEGRLPRKTLERTKAEQPYYEPQHEDEIRRCGPAWLERWIHGGRLESAGLIPREIAQEVFSKAASGEVADLYRALALLGIEIWLQARDIEV